MSSEKINASFNPKSNAFKSILKEPKEEKRSFGKEEFLARRRFFLEKLESEGGIPKPKPFVSKSPAVNKKASVEINKTSHNKDVNPTSTIKNNEKIKKTPRKINTDINIEKENVCLPDHEWSISSAKSESLRKIIDLANKGETNTVGKSVFSARQKFFADSQLSNVDQLMPRPSTPPGFCYIERCPSPFENSKRRNSYNTHSNTQTLSNSPIVAPNPKPASPSLSGAIFSLPWEYGDKKKEIVQPKPQPKMNITLLEDQSLVPEDIIKLPEPISFKKESLSIDQPTIIQIEKVEVSKPMTAKILESLPSPVQFNIEALSVDMPLFVNIIKVDNIEPQLPKHFFILPESVISEKVLLPNDEPIEIITETIPMPEMNIPKIIHILPEPVSITREILPQDDLLNVITETVVADEKQIPQIITILPEPVKVTNELLSQEKPLEVKIENVIAEEKQIPETLRMVDEEFFYERDELKSDLLKTTNFSPLTLESNIQEKKETKKAINDDIINSYYFNETQQLIDIDNEMIETVNEKQSLHDFDSENIYDMYDNITENSSINSNSSISEYLNKNGTLNLDEPLPRKSIPIYNNNEEQLDDLINLSENDVTDNVKNWYNIIDNSINEEDSLEEKI